jgi:tetratricopeptide (TPR) repeat protein
MDPTCGFGYWCPSLAYQLPAAQAFPWATMWRGLFGALVAWILVAQIVRQRREKAQLARVISARPLAERLVEEARQRHAGSVSADVLAATIGTLLYEVQRRTPGMSEAMAFLERGRLEAAEEQLAAAANHLAVKRRRKSQRRAGVFFGHLATIAMLRDAEKAAQAYAKAAELNPKDAAALLNLGLLQERSGRGDAAIETLERMLAVGEKTRNRAIVLDAANCLGALFEARGAFADAEWKFRKALAASEAMKNQPRTAYLYGRLGLIRRLRGELADAEALHRKSLAIFEKLDIAAGVAAQYGDLGTIFRLRADLEQAEAMYVVSLSVSDKAGLAELSANQHTSLGTLLMQRGDVGEARVHLHKAQALFQKLGFAREVQHVERLLTGAPVSVH